MSSLFSIEFLGALALIVSIIFAARYIIDKKAEPTGVTYRNIDGVEKTVGSKGFVNVGVFEGIAAVIALTTFVILGSNVALAGVDDYNEYWNGVETSAYKDVVECKKDGRCKHTYRCDPYLVTKTGTRSVPDGQGGTRTETYTYTETEYHNCPYVTHETSYFVEDSLGEKYTIGKSLFPENPEQHRWRTERRDKDELPSVESGVPVAWKEAKERLDSGKPGGTTIRKSYDNYILASQNTVYEKYSDKAEFYLADGVLPKVATEIYDGYKASKLYHNIELKESKKWQQSLMNFNGKFGTEKQGDLHVVLIDSTKVNRADYPLALEAFWHSKDLGKNTISKNAVVVVAGVSNNKADWLDGFTGMPGGNEKVVADIANLDLELSPEGFFGKESSLTQLLLSSYERVEMADYEYLKGSLAISGLERFFVFLTSIMAATFAGILVYWLRKRKFNNRI